jgi:chemotaxis protein MotB
MARRKEAHGGGHGWFVTFADLMGLLVSFFVMLVAFSNQDAKKVQAVAGSMRDAFGVQKVARFSGVMERDALPTRSKIKNVAFIPPELSSVTPSSNEKGEAPTRDKSLKIAAASLRQVLEAMPELAEISKHISFEETNKGLNLELVDQESAPMFAAGSREPDDRIRDFFQKIAAPLKAVPYRIAIIGHTASAGDAQLNYGHWNLSADRANAVRQILETGGYPPENVYEVMGKGETEPLLPEAPALPSNRRVTITLVYAPPPIPPDLHP